MGGGLFIRYIIFYIMSIKIKHKRNSTDGAVPTATNIDYGEIAMNYSAGSEKLFIKNSNNAIAEFPSKNELVTIIDDRIRGTKDMGGVVLFECDYNSPNYDTITLSDSVANYSYVDIYCATDDKHVLFQRVYEPQGKMVSFSASLVGGSNYFTKCKVYLLSGTSMTTATYTGNKMAGLWGTHNSDTFERSDSYVGCYRVIGYITN